MKILIVKDPWSKMIINGFKDLEVRGSNTKYRGMVLIAESGTGTIIGSCYLIGSFYTRRTLFDLLRPWHKIKEPYSKLPYKRPHCWKLCWARRFDKPIPYRHPQGAVIWVKDPLNVIDPSYHQQLLELEQECDQKWRTEHDSVSWLRS